VRHQRVEADLFYFADDIHDLDSGQPLILVECKRPGKGSDAGVGQARSYAYWIKPAYYVITDAQTLTAWDYQGGAVPDVKAIEITQNQIRDRFDDLYARLNPGAALAARNHKIERLAHPPHAGQP